jgi:PTS system mannose-specific IID component
MSVFPRRVAARVLLRSLLVQGSWNYETLIGTGFAFTIRPVLRYLHPTDDAALDAAVERHVGVFNSHPYFATVAVGAVARLEADGADPRMVERFKSALRGSLGSLGDQLVWSAWRPATLLLGLLLLIAGAAWWVAVVVFLTAYNLLNVAIRVWGWSVGTRSGLEVGKTLRETPLQPLAARVADVGAVLGGFVTVLALARLPVSPVTSGFALVAAAVGILLGARTRQLFIAVLALVWFINLAWAWSR